jgi:SIR2-like protein
MRCLDQEFRETLGAEVDDDGSVVVGGIPFTPVKILETEPESYKEAFLIWLNETWIPTRDETLKDILAHKTNEQRFFELTESVKGGRVVPFVGSGMTVPCGMPQWSRFLRDLRGSTKLTEDSLEQLLTQGLFEEAASQLRDAMPSHLFDERLDQTFKSRSDSAGAIRLLPEIFTGTVITTNFDDVLEQLYKKSEKPYGEVLRGNAVGRFRKVRATGTRCLLKIHGHHSEGEGRVLTKEEYEAAYGHGCPARTELRSIFSTEPLLFMGCSLANDRTIRLLKEIVDSDPQTPRNFAFMSRPDDGTQIDREHFLADRKIFPIWYDGDHNECVEALLVGILKATGKL